jgi:putative methionine-R-sulfoxide reductase with GAF domain
LLQYLQIITLFIIAINQILYIMKIKPFCKILSRKKYVSCKEELQRNKMVIASAINFINSIEAGELEIHFEKQFEETAIANSLKNMHDKMKAIAKEEQQRNWAAEGLAKFSNILRQENSSIIEFGDIIIREIVKYLNINQGSIFMVENDENDNEYIKILGTYAYNKKKYCEQKRIEIGEGLVGQCYLEKDIIYMTDVPQFYVNITSGLGEATPNSILLVPLIVKDTVYGVVELASFGEFKKHEIEFLQKLSENIASAISSAKIADRTNKLLQEAQQQTEEIRAQEEELRQNMEEMEATTEEMMRQRKELENKDLEMKKVIAEMQANEADMQKMEDKHRALIKEHLKMKKELRDAHGKIITLQNNKILEENFELKQYG